MPNSIKEQRGRILRVKLEFKPGRNLQRSAESD